MSPQMPQISSWVSSQRHHSCRLSTCARSLARRAHNSRHSLNKSMIYVEIYIDPFG